MSGRARGALTAVVAMASRASSQLALVGVTLVATRTLSPSDFGVFAIAAAFVTLARTLLYTGPFEFLMKAPDREAVAGAALCANGVVALASALGLVLIGAASPWLFHNGAVALLMFALAPSNAIAAFASWEEALLLREGYVTRYYGVTVATECLSALLAVALLLAGWGLFALAAQIYARLVLLALAYRVMVAWPSRLTATRAGVGEVLHWSVGRYGTVIVSFLSNYSGDLLLGIVLSPAATGIYRASNRVVTALADMFAQPAGLLATTALSARRAAGHPSDRLWIDLLAGIAAIGWPALIGLAMMSDRLAPLVLGHAWAAAGPVIAVLCLARMAGLVTAVCSAALVVEDRQKRVLAVQSAGSLGIAGLTLLLAPRGIVPAAIAASVIAVLVAVAMVRSAWSLEGARPANLAGAMLTVAGPVLGTVAGVMGGELLARHLLLATGPGIALPIVLGIVGWLSAAAWVRRPLFRALQSFVAVRDVAPQAG
jgi:O-antigen/teichoic acid export membrane protein